MLLLGQDAGAFRPGISANDIFTLISSLTVYRVTNHQVMVENMLGVNFNTQENIDGMHRLTVDAVLQLDRQYSGLRPRVLLTSSSFDTEEGDEASHRISTARNNRAGPPAHALPCRSPPVGAVVAKA